jgi:glycosyltransferase involved in cell wall biosynthesis
VIHASVIVPVHNAEETLPRTLAHLRAQAAPFAYEVVVVDDGSSDRSAEHAAAGGPPIRLVRQAAAGPAAARNRGVALSRGAVLAFCDADCFPTPGWLAAGARALEHADLVQGRVLPIEGVERGPFDRTLWITEEVGLWETANLFVRRELFDQAGGFEDWLTPDRGKALGEDVWLGWRLKRLGARSAFCPEALSHHAVFARGWADYVTERRRLAHFPDMVAKIPELRDAFFYGRYFLSRRTAAFDVALIGAITGALFRRHSALLACLPYAQILRRRARGFGRRAPVVAGIELAADAYGALALLRGTMRARAAVL